jgi:hypothetical protein
MLFFHSRTSPAIISLAPTQSDILARDCRLSHPAYDITAESSEPQLSSLRIADKMQGVLRKHMVACYQVCCGYVVPI